LATPALVLPWVPAVVEVVADWVRQSGRAGPGRVQAIGDLPAFRGFDDVPAGLRQHPRGGNRVATHHPAPAAKRFGAKRLKLACRRQSPPRTATSHKRRGVLVMNGSAVRIRSSASFPSRSVNVRPSTSHLHAPTRRRQPAHFRGKLGEYLPWVVSPATWPLGSRSLAPGHHQRSGRSACGGGSGPPTQIQATALISLSRCR